ncbi:MAG TPA: hypothetical protein VNC84_03660 [Gammaproteobacteria bacterium]|jgi:MFS family permease|nr:hypothetical protein [Gammaproteobacteria bacterium]
MTTTAEAAHQKTETSYSEYIKNTGIYLLSLLGAMAVGFQNYLALMDLIKKLSTISVALSKAWLLILHGTAVFLGICSTTANFCFNIDLLEGFVERFFPKDETKKKKRRKLSAWEEILYWVGIGAFVITGIMFGLTAFAFGMTGPIAILGIIAGVFQAILMTIQEVETWLRAFDDDGKNNIKKKKKSLWQTFVDWSNSLTLGKFAGYVICVGNVLALSLLFAFGLATFLITVSVPLVPAVITGFAFALTFGTFTEFFFYNTFLSKFCNKFSENIEKFWDSTYSPLGLFACAINGIVNAGLSYAGIMLLVGLVATTGIAMPPIAAIITVSMIASVFAGAASFILGIDFWTANSARLSFKPKEETAETTKNPAFIHSTPDIAKKFTPTPTPTKSTSTLPKGIGTLISTVGLRRSLTTPSSADRTFSLTGRC